MNKSESNGTVKGTGYRGLDVGNVLGSFRLDISYEDQWNASSWRQENQTCVRDITADINLNMSFNDLYDFEHNPEYNWWQNFWRETIPSYIAGDGTKFHITGSINYNTTVTVIQQQ